MCGFDCPGCSRCTPGFGALALPRNEAGEIAVAGLTLTEWTGIATVVLAVATVYGAFTRR
jgi:hypothetical protein